MTTIACVLKTGTWKNRHMKIAYSAKHVQWLGHMVNKFCRIPHRFVCLTDTKIGGVETIPLKDNLLGWWSKMELFREFQSCFYLDLDTVIVGDISEIVDYPHKFSALRNFSSTPDTKRMGSAVLAWNGDYRFLYNRFMTDPKRHMIECSSSKKWGDQGFIAAELGGAFDRFQDLFPGQIVSQKKDMKNNVLPADARIVCFHGKPKPWEVKADWIPEL
ncbi:MAG: hypothetical protein GX565_07445 [Lentisphaerae bacterium]|nr:hypothetical protein [Lentisphaerota bacterium]